jgi:hypothetical protein
MNGIGEYYDSLLAKYQREIDKQAQEEEEREEEMGKLKDKIADLLEENHPAELERLTGYDDVICKKIVHQLYMEGFNDRNCWEAEYVGYLGAELWAIYGKNFSGEWINEDGEYMGFDTKEEAEQYIKETFK